MQELSSDLCQNLWNVFIKRWEQKKQQHLFMMTIPYIQWMREKIWIQKIWNRPTQFFSTINYRTVRYILMEDDFYHWVLCVQNHGLLGVDKACVLADICFIVCCRGEQDLREDGGFNPFFLTQVTYFPTILFFIMNVRRLVRKYF